MQRSTAIKSTLFALWALLVASVAALLWNQDRFFAVEMKVIATLAQRERGGYPGAGTTLVRPDGSMVWAALPIKGGLHDGDRVATGHGTRARVSFGPGRDLILGDDSQVEITTITYDHNKRAYVVDVTNGTIKAEVNSSCKGCPAIIVKAGGRRYTLDSGDQVAIVKEAGKKVQAFSGKKALLPVFRNFKVQDMAETKTAGGTSGGADAAGGPDGADAADSAAHAGADTTLASLDQSVAQDLAEGPAPAPAPPPPPPKAPPPPPLPKAESFEVDVRPPQTGLTYWTTLPLSSLSAEAVSFPVVAPAEKPKQGDWKPLLEVSAAGAGKGRSEVLSLPHPSDTQFRLPVMKLRGLAQIYWHGGLKEYAASVRGGAEVSRGKQKTQSFSQRRQTVRILTYGEYPGGPVSIGLDQWSAPADAPGPWMEPKAPLSVGEAPFQIRLLSSLDYAKFLPFIRGAKGVGIERTGLADDGQGLFVVRNQSVIAQLGGSAMGPDMIQKLMTLLDADFVFKGARSALLDTRGATQNTLVESIGALLDHGKRLYILKRNTVYPVNRDFIKTNAEVAKFIDKAARAIFLEDVAIVASR